jgi:transposase
VYHVIGVLGYERVGCWRKVGIFHLRSRVPSSRYRCPQCGNRGVIRGGLVDRMAHAARVGMDRTVLFIQTRHLECRKCQRVLNGWLPGIGHRWNYTKSFASMVVDLRKMMTIRDVSE